MTTRTLPRRRLVNILTAAEYADVHARTIRRYIAAGRLRAYRVGPRLVKIDLDDVDAMLRPIPSASGGGPGDEAA